MNNPLSKHILESVAEFRSAVGFGEQSNVVHEQLFASESIELFTAKSFSEKADAFADMAVVMAGHKLHGNPFYDFDAAIEGLNWQANLNDIDLIEAFDIVMVSNMSKVCYSNKNARLTDEKYSKEGVFLQWKELGGSCACYSADDYPDKPKGKLLKPVTYVEPDWSGISWRTDLKIASHWNRKELLPPVNTPILLTLDSGKIITATRPDYVKNRHGNLGYFATNCMGKITSQIDDDIVVKWQYV